MITIDNRAGSKELYVPLLAKRLPVVLDRLEFGDVAFLGRGVDDCPVPIGVEHKQIEDALRCITDGRFVGHQLPGMLRLYQVSWLLLEGEFRPSHSGVLQVAHRGQFFDARIANRSFMYRDFDSWIMTLQMRAGVRVWRTRDQHESVSWLASLYGWWTSKPWAEHRSHLAFDGSDALGGNPDAALLVRPSLLRRVCKELTGLGWDKSLAAASYWRTLERMMAADVHAWQEMPWTDKAGVVRRLGPATAAKIWKELHS